MVITFYIQMEFHSHFMAFKIVEISWIGLFWWILYKYTLCLCLLKCGTFWKALNFLFSFPIYYMNRIFFHLFIQNIQITNWTEWEEEDEEKMISIASVIGWFSNSNDAILKGGKIIGCIHVVGHQFFSGQWMPCAKCTCGIHLNKFWIQI